jgi:hypothetical protein
VTRYRTVLALVLVSIAGVGSNTALAASGGKPQAVTLRLSDLPRGFKRAMAHTVTNTSAALANHLPLKTFTKHGRISSYEIGFARRVTRGMSYVYAETVAYRSDAGASWEYALDLSQLGKSHLQRVSAATVGEASVAFRLVQKSGKLSGTSDFIRFRRGAWVATVEVQGATGTVSMDQAVSLARVIDGRIQASG